MDTRDIDKDYTIKSLQSLVAVLESGLSIVSHRMAGAPEPHPGATSGVVQSSLIAVEIARSAGIVPRRKNA